MSEAEGAPKSLLSSSVGRLRVIGMIEGTSLLLILGVGMPLKYMMDVPEANYWLGRIHGGLWMIFLLSLVDAWLDRGWSVLKVGALFIASCLPFGPFIADRKLKAET